MSIVVQLAQTLDPCDFAIDLLMQEAMLILSSSLIASLFWVPYGLDMR